MPKAIKEEKEEKPVKKVTTPKVAKVVAPKTEAVKATPKKSSGLSVPVFSLVGKEVSTLELPKEVFGVEVNKSLLDQAMHIYLNNQKAHWGNTKTRGEVVGSTRKIWKQKGTGRARHGSIMAPIFVGGGIALGPKSRKVELELPKKMKRAALVSALSQKVTENQVMGVDGLDKMTGKTRDMANFVKNLGKKSVLIVAEDKKENAFRSTTNLKNTNLVVADNLSILDIFKHQAIVFTSGAVQKLQTKVEGEKR